MNFTREDILKILNALLQLGRKDSEFKDANTPLNSEDYIAILLDGINKKISINNLLSTLGLLKKDDFINVSDRYDEYYIQLSEAISIIANNKRKKGLVITFQDINGTWKVYLFNDEISNFIKTEYWKDLFDFKYPIINTILPDEEDLTLTYPNIEGNSFIKLKDKEYDLENFSGMATKILRKHIIEIDDPELGKIKKNILYQDDFNKENCIYIIKYDFNLNNLTINIPENSIIRFEGGTLKDGTIESNNTLFSYINYPSLINIKLRNFKNLSINIDCFLLNDTDDITPIIKDLVYNNIGITILFDNKNYYLSECLLAGVTDFTLLGYLKDGSFSECFTTFLPKDPSNLKYILKLGGTSDFSAPSDDYNENIYKLYWCKNFKILNIKFFSHFPINYNEGKSGALCFVYAVSGIVLVDGSNFYGNFIYILESWEIVFKKITIYGLQHDWRNNLDITLCPYYGITFAKRLWKSYTNISAIIIEELLAEALLRLIDVQAECNIGNSFIKYCSFEYRFTKSWNEINYTHITFDQYKELFANSVKIPAFNINNLGFNIETLSVDYVTQEKIEYNGLTYLPVLLLLNNGGGTIDLLLSTNWITANAIKSTHYTLVINNCITDLSYTSPNIFIGENSPYGIANSIIINQVNGFKYYNINSDNSVVITDGYYSINDFRNLLKKEHTYFVTNNNKNSLWIRDDGDLNEDGYCILSPKITFNYEVLLYRLEASNYNCLYLYSPNTNTYSVMNKSGIIGNNDQIAIKGKVYFYEITFFGEEYRVVADLSNSNKFKILAPLIYNNSNSTGNSILYKDFTGKFLDYDGHPRIQRRGRLTEMPILQNTAADIGISYYNFTDKTPYWWDGNTWKNANGITLGLKTNGSSEERPTSVKEGFEYYDSTLKKKILWNGTSWVNVDGTELG